jgi:hypothetical protein
MHGRFLRRKFFEQLSVSEPLWLKIMPPRHKGTKHHNVILQNLPAGFSKQSLPKKATKIVKNQLICAFQGSSGSGYSDRLI